ncbi:phosphatidylinositol 4-phosphate 5-kinase type-1 beta-like [Myzus persicae]|uniref:phosphatidylinositol 4-phosphate 5-kinase type-1 beta-like n=1 Tax=Myzus persicae TaxID=13164 RepID=UPI000B93437C|nr:phosphatidylinositol 4-phosphate 5-kinase type-1 beta-like [Myzus persicae]
MSYAGSKKDDPVSDPNSPRNKENVKETDPIKREIHITQTQTDEMRDSIQRGIRYVIKDITKNHYKGLSPRDFTDIEETVFQSWLDTDVSPPRRYKKFTFITYAPKAFRDIRRLFNIRPYDYIQSCSHSSLRKIPNPGASASIFYFTNDDKFIMKSVQFTEFKVLQHLLPLYRQHMKKNPLSLLPKFSGLYGYKINEINIQFISMNNLLPSNIKMHLKYDLKGSTFKRTASTGETIKRMPTFKDLDFIKHFQDGLFLMPHTLSDILETINSDCEFLKSFNIMDYSLLVGVHKVDEDTSTYSQAALARWKRLMVDSIGLEDILADTGHFPDENCPTLKGSVPAKSESGEKLLLFLGIIDILQEYRITKIIEHGFKTITQSKNISVQDPDTYAPRLMNFLINFVFKPLLTNEELGARSKQSFKAGSSKLLNDDDFDDTSCISCFKRKKSSRNTINKNDLN